MGLVFVVAGCRVTIDAVHVAMDTGREEKPATTPTKRPSSAVISASSWQSRQPSLSVWAAAGRNVNERQNRASRMSRAGAEVIPQCADVCIS